MKLPNMFLLAIFALGLVTDVCAQAPVAEHKAKTISTKTAEKNNEADSLFQRDKVWNIQLIVTPEEWKKIEPATTNMPSFGPPNGQRNQMAPPPAGERPNGPPRGGMMNIDFPEVRATFEFEGQAVGEIGLRYKGNSTYMAARNLPKKSFKIDFNQFVKKQKIFGQTKLNLNNNMMDASMIREAISYEIFRQAGVPAPRTSFARVYLTVSGEKERQYLGLYTIVEQVDERFLRSYFTDDNGLLLKPQMVRGLPYFGEEWKNYVTPYEAKNEPPAAEAQRFIALTKLVNEANDETFNQQIRTFMNVPAFLKFLAINGLLVNMDSILAMGQNYYIYHDTTEDQFHWIPWDLNMSFGGFPSGTVEQMIKLSIQHPHAGEHKLIDRLLAIPELKAAYLAIVKDVYEKNLNPETLLADLEKLQATVRPAIADESAQALQQFDRAMSESADRSATPPPPQALGGFGGPPRTGGPMGMGGVGMPLKPFILKRLNAIKEQLAGTSEGYVPHFGGPKGRGPRGLRPGGPAGGPPPLGFGPFGNPGEMVGLALFQKADLDRNHSVTKGEFAQIAKALFAEWSKAKAPSLDDKAVGAGLFKLMFQNGMPAPPDGMAPPPMMPMGDERPNGGPEKFFAAPFLRAMDKDRDRQITAREWQGEFARWFTAWDADKSAKLTDNECKAGIGRLFDNEWSAEAPSQALPKPEKTNISKAPSKKKSQ